VASELGLPATFALAALVIMAGWKSLRSIRHGRRRALRAGCLVAALLVAVHGLADVPGHRLAIAWAAAFLFSLSLPPDDEVRRAPRRVWPLRVAGGGILGLGVWIFVSFYADLVPAARPAYVAGARAGQEAAALYIGDALELRPLDRGLYHLQGFLALHYDDKLPTVERAFALERALDSTWVGAPMRQAQAWSRIDPERTGELWKEALRRARAVEERKPGSPWGVAATLRRISTQARGNPKLERHFQELKAQ